MNSEIWPRMQHFVILQYMSTVSKNLHIGPPLQFYSKLYFFEAYIGKEQKKNCNNNNNKNFKNLKFSRKFEFLICSYREISTASFIW